MKTMTIMLVVLLALGIMAPMVAAADDATILEPTPVNQNIVVEEPGITPDSPLYGLDKAMERVRLAMTRGKAEKAKLKLKFAEERLAETEEMLDEGNEEAAAKAEEAYNEELEETEELVEEIESDSDEGVAEEALEDVEEVKLGLMAHAEKVAFVKNRTLERLRAGNASSEQLAHLEEVFGRIQVKAQETEAKMEEKRTRVRTAYKVLSGINESDVEALEERIRNRIKDKVGIGDDSDDDAEEDESEVEVEDDENETEDEFEEDTSTGPQVQAGQ